MSTLSTQHSLMRHHEDSGIEMSPMKKDDNLEGDDFLERARKVSPLAPSIGERRRKYIRRPITIAKRQRALTAI